jgi:signal peptide peptidase SppA
VLKLLHQLAFGADVSDIDVAAVLSGGREAAAGRSPQFVSSGRGKATALVSAHGIALHKLEFQPFAFSTALLAQNVTALSVDPSVERIVISYDTPGGSVVGTSEAADAIFAARQRKPVISFVDSLAASAGYWLASQGTSIVAIPSASVGSIGVWTQHLDASGALEKQGLKVKLISNSQSPHKTDGNPYGPLSPEALAFEQKEVDAIARQFIAAVARGRGVSSSTVQEQFGKGRVYRAATDGKKLGMVDKIAGMDDVFAGRTDARALEAGRVAEARRRRLQLAKFR